MRRSSLVLGTVLLGLATAPIAQPRATASCAGPYLEIEDALVLDRGAPFTVEGSRFIDGCRDSMGCQVGPGCDDCEYDDPPTRPRDDVHLELAQGDRSWPLDTADADDRGQVTWTFEVPRGAEPGRAKLVVAYATSARVRIR